MSEKVFAKIAAGLNEAIAIVRGEMTAARIHTPEDIAARILAKQATSEPAPQSPAPRTLEKDTQNQPHEN